MPRKRDLRKTPKFLMPKTYREFLVKAMAEEGRANQSSHKPAARYTPECLTNNHGRCGGWVTLAHGKESTRVECYCHCHDSLLVEM